jgi:beta-glucanase (GH16 family)
MAAALCLGACASDPPVDHAGGGGAVGSAGGATGAGGAGWRLVWSDEFEGPTGSAVDATKWTFDLGNNNGWGNNELEDYTSRTDNAALDGTGNLVVTARKESLGGQSYTSARLLTQGKASWTHGRFEARIKIPFGQGLWPAFWMLGDNIGTAGWPACGEVDIMENIGREPAIVHGTMHGPGYSGANGIGGPLALTGAGRYADVFHVFAVEWEPNAIRWYVDQTLYFSTKPASIPAGTIWAYDHPFFLILNVAVGGGWPGSPDGTTVFPQTMTVDYVRVYQR